MKIGPQTVFADQLHAEKYRQKGEDFRGAMNRVAFAMADGHDHYHDFREVLLDMRFMPGGRIQAAMGAAKKVTPYNCLSGSTKILTKEFGSIEIEKVSGQTVHLLDGNGSWTPCMIFDHGDQETVSITFSGGFEKVEIRSTLEHGWIKPNGLVVKTKAFADTGSIEIADLRPSKAVSDADAYAKGIVHGLVYGDGSMDCGAARLRVCSHHDSIIPLLESYNFSMPPSYDGDPNYRIPAKDVWCNLKALPVVGSLDYLLGFLRGWFAADGCVSTQPEATICGDLDEYRWISKWGPLVGWHTRGATPLADATNFGGRKKDSHNIRLKKSSMDIGDFLIAQHGERWATGHVGKTGRGWRVRGCYSDKRVERVYCPVVPTTHSFALACGIHSQNCFVASKIDDSFVEGENSIMGVATQAAQTMRMGGGIGYDFSTLRPSGALIKKLGSRSSGPMAFMNIFNEVCRATSSAGNRRGAQMGVLRVDHPDIVAFVHAKNNLDKLNGFNISVAVTDEFMEAVDKQETFELKFDGRVYDEIDALELYEMMMRSTWDWAEPGILFIDTINRMNNLWYCEEIAATNPCGEQPLAPNAACLLGSFNLVRYIRKDKQTGLYYFDYDQLKADIPHVVRAMNMVIDRAIYPLQAQRDAAHAKRRMGLGVTGVANAIETLGFPYGTPDYIAMQDTILSAIEHGAYLASIDLAKEKGPFPLFDAEKYLQGQYIKTLPDDVRDGIAKHGIRNSHLLSIAPTGTISNVADNISTSIEPVFDVITQRPVFMAEGQVIVDLEDYASANFGTKPKTTDEVTLDEHLAVLLNATQHVDSAVSKTCNTAGDNTPWDEFKALYRRAWEGGAKGVTTFNKDGKRLALLTKGVAKASNPVEDKDEEQPEKMLESCEFDAATGRRSCE